MNPLTTTFDEFAQHVLSATKRGFYHSSALYRDFFVNGRSDFSAHAHWTRYRDQAALLSHDIVLPNTPTIFSSDDGTTKFITRLHDGLSIESVLIPESRRNTLCISSQAGCVMGCVFCATGQGEFHRNLTVEEIVGQVFSARFFLKQPVHNLVFMGMGEPLENLDNVAQALRVLNDQRGFNLPFSRMTISTAGHIEGIQRLASLGFPRLRLAVSLNAAYDELRDKLMPINRHYSLSKLRRVLEEYPLGKREVVLIGYVLLSEVNDSLEDAKRLADFLHGLRVRINIIPFNECATLPYRTPSSDRVKAFCTRLIEAGFFVRVRQPHGTGIGAGCGQLVGNEGNSNVQTPNPKGNNRKIHE